jgi:putative cell wall-binding protein
MRKAGPTSRRFIVGGLTLLLCASSLATGGQTFAQPSTVPAVDRVAGLNRYDTAAQVATRFGENQCVVVIANGENFPDGLASATFYAPILLTRTNSLPVETENYLAVAANDPVCEGTYDIIIVGGLGAVSSGVEQLLGSYGSVFRIEGPNRYQTALAVAEDLVFFDAIEGALLTTGRNFPDALSGGVLAQWYRAPILLNDGTTLRADVKSFLVGEGLEYVGVLGGPSAVPESVLDEIAALGIDVFRLSGPNRASTAAVIAYAMDEQGPLNTVVLVNGFGFADALSAATYAYDDAFFSDGMTPLLLAAPNSLPPATAQYLAEFCSSIGRIVVIGGTSAVSDAVVNEAVAAATCPAP